MTETQTTTRSYNNLHIPTREEFHRNFGGIIYQSDFSTDNRGKDNLKGSQVAKRIETDRNNEEKLRREGKYNYGWK